MEFYETKKVFTKVLQKLNLIDRNVLFFVSLLIINTVCIFFSLTLFGVYVIKQRTALFVIITSAGMGFLRSSPSAMCLRMTL